MLCRNGFTAFAHVAPPTACALACERLGYSWPTIASRLVVGLVDETNERVRGVGGDGAGASWADFVRAGHALAAIRCAERRLARLALGEGSAVGSVDTTDSP